MSVLKAKITDDMKAAMKARDAQRLGAIRLLMAEMKRREVDERIELSDADVLAIIDKMLKQRRDSLSQYQAAGRSDLASVEESEIAVLSAYMPRQLDESEIDAAIVGAIASTGAQGPKDMGKVMTLLRQQLAGQADLARVSGRVKARLSG